MKIIVKTIMQIVAEERMPVIQLEIDYQLVTLHDAMKKKDEKEKEKAKERLRELTKELKKLEKHLI